MHVRVSSWRSLQLVQFETVTLNDYSGLLKRLVILSN